MKVSIQFCAKRFAVIAGGVHEVFNFEGIAFDKLPTFVNEKLEISKDDIVCLPTLSNAKYNAYALAIQHFIMAFAVIAGAKCQLVKPISGAKKQELSAGYSGASLNTKVDKALLSKLPDDWPQDTALARAKYLHDYLA